MWLSWHSPLNVLYMSACVLKVTQKFRQRQRSVESDQIDVSRWPRSFGLIFSYLSTCRVILFPAFMIRFWASLWLKWRASRSPILVMTSPGLSSPSEGVPATACNKNKWRELGELHAKQTYDVLHLMLDLNLHNDALEKGLYRIALKLLTRDLFLWLRYVYFCWHWKTIWLSALLHVKSGFI